MQFVSKQALDMPHVRTGIDFEQSISLYMHNL